MKTDEIQELLERFEPREAQVLELPRQLCAARFSPCGRYLAAVGTDSLIYRWKTTAEDYSDLPTLDGHHGWVQSLAYHPNADNVFFTVDSWGQLICWKDSEEDDAPVADWKQPEAHDGWVVQLAISPDGNQLATCGIDRVVRVWATGDGRKLAEFDGHQAPVQSVCFHPNGTALVSGDLTGTILQWNWAEQQQVRTFDASDLFTEHRLQDVGGVRCMTFSPDGSQLLCGGTRPKNGGNVQGVPLILVFDWESGEQQQAIELGATADVYVFEMQFHPEGFLMAATSGNPGNGKLLFLRLEDDEPFFISTQMANCHSISLHPNGKRLALVATNRNSAGNGRNLGKDGEYPGNWSPIHLFDLGRETDSEGEPAG